MLKSVIIEHMAQMAETRSFLLLLFRPGNEAKWNIVMQARWACHVCLVNWIECFKWQCESRVLKVVGDVIVQASWACEVVCALVSLTKEVSTSVKLEISQDTNCGWWDIMVQANWACDVRHVYRWLRRRETALLGWGQNFKKVAGWCSVKVLFIQESLGSPVWTILVYWWIFLSISNSGSLQWILMFVWAQL